MKRVPKHYRWYRAKSIKICVGCFIGIMPETLYLRTDRDHTTPVHNAYCQGCAQAVKGFRLPADVAEIPLEKSQSLVKRVLRAVVG